MRKNWTLWTTVLVLTLIVLSLLASVSGAAFAGGALDEAYPTPEMVVEGPSTSDQITGLIIGAFVLVLIIFGGVVWRRIKS